MLPEFYDTITCAPEAYDSFGTETIEILGKTKRRGRAVRLVRTPAQHVEWQRMRYSSGLHLSMDISRAEDAKLFYTPMDAEAWAKEVRVTARSLDYHGELSLDALLQRLPEGLSREFVARQCELVGLTLDA